MIELVVEQADLVFNNGDHFILGLIGKFVQSYKIKTEICH